ncbi:MAG: zinc ribbon domain-containing protein [Planctomycetes bacterium]|nr:zinc ribbon domain-containing protein [Planctomycetota bacterium]
MGLVRCAECGREVSDRAESCPQCGFPLSASPDMVGGRQIRGIEKTAKRFKAHILLATIALIVGVIWTVGSCEQSKHGSVEPMPILLTFFSAIWLLIAKLLAWWHHG